MAIKKELFGDGSGNPVDGIGAVAWTTASTTISVRRDAELVCEAVVTEDSALAVEISVQISPPGQADWQEVTVARNVVGAAATVYQEPLRLRVPGSIDTHPFVFPVPPLVDVRLRVRLVNGKPNVAVYIRGFIRELEGESSASLWSGLTGKNDVNLAEIDGTTVVEGGANGSLGVGGIVAAGDPAADQPVEIGGVDGTGTLRTLLVGTAGRPQNDIDRIAGSDVATTQTAGVVPTEEQTPQVLSTDTALDDGAGSAETLTTSYGDSEGSWVDLESACSQVSWICTTSGTAPDSLELDIQWNTAAGGGGTTVQDEADNSVVGGQLEIAPLYVSLIGRDNAALPNGTYSFRLARPAWAESFRIRAKHTGGDATTALLATAYQEI
jgi:hypothetical protein